MRPGRSRAAPRRGARVSSLNHGGVAAILAAGGSGERARSGSAIEPKQFRVLAGRSVLLWSLDALEAAGCDPIVVVLPAGLTDAATGISHPVVEGGDTRQQSVANGLAAVGDPTRVVVHDAARPFVSPDMISAVIDALEEGDGAVTALPVEETIKRVRDGKVSETVDRTDLWRMQTPQAFRTEVLRGAHEVARREGRFDATDDAQLVERYGGTIVIVDGSPRNIKLTYAEDLEIAELLMRARG